MTAEENLYVIALEECAEIQQCITKILRFGEKSCNPQSMCDNNEFELLKEYYQLQAVMEMLVDNGSIGYLPEADIEKIKISKKDKILYYTQVSKRLGQVK